MMTTALALTMNYAGPAAAQERRLYPINISATTVAEGLRNLATSTGASLVFSPEQVRDLRTRGISGQMTIDDALQSLLSGTGLSVRTNGKGAYVIVGSQASNIVPLKVADVAVSERAPVQLAAAPAPQAAQAPQEEIVVTGSRIVREGYEAPTPLTVVDTEAIQTNSSGNVADFINTMPVFAGSATPANTQNGVSGGNIGLNVLNLRGMGGTRNLVLLDGQRSVGSLVNGSVDINVFPQQLIQRVDVVTGGASAVYGSDAVSGVANFILDKTFTGVKGEVTGGMTSYLDDEAYSLALSGGFPFAGGRGHVLLSGEHVYKAGVPDGRRDWNGTGLGIMVNPAYGTGAGQSRNVPEYLLLDKIGISNATPGGIIVSGPLKGIAFGAGGAPFQLTYGDLVSNPDMRGGDWKYTEVRQKRGVALDPYESRQNVFTRFSYDVTDNVNLFAQFSWASTNTANQTTPSFYLGNITVKADNAFMPESVRTRMTALGLTSFTLGSMTEDLGVIGADNVRMVNRNVVGGNGSFGAFGSDWSWNAYFQNGYSRSSVNATGVSNRPRTTLAIDAVRNANGQIVCRSTLTNPTNGCVPFNIMGTGVNTTNALDYLIGVSYLYQKLTQNVWAASVSGEPLSLWAGPVSLALSAEHRNESSRGMSDPQSRNREWFSGNYLPTEGKSNVTEGAVEIIVPLAKGEAWADAWDLSAAARATDYSLSGYVTTWKVGTTYTPIPDIRIRVTQSRDIRAPNLQDLFQAGFTAQSQVLDPFRGNVSTPYTILTTGNPALKPEKADTTGIGVVVQPAFIPGLSFSADYWNIKIDGAIGSVGQQNIVDFCFQGDQAFCAAITRGPAVAPATIGPITQIAGQPFNISKSITRGLDFEATYRFALSDMVDSWGGNLRLHANASHYIKDYQNNGISTPTETSGQNAGNNAPKWRVSATATYDYDPIRIGLTARAVSSGTYNNSWIVCSTACPVSTVDHRTININHMAGAIYFDASVTYRFEIAAANVETFLNIRNLANTDPVPLANGPGGNVFFRELANSSLYDKLGRVFRAGVRFKM